jgi:plastocyanin
MKAIKKIIWIASFGASIVIFDHAIPVSGETATVLVAPGSLSFSPAITSISVNDSVIWRWSASGHSSTSGTVSSGGTKSPNGLWDSGIKNNGQAFTNKFTSTGTFPFYCSTANHAVSGMTGAVFVAAANIPPAILITNPAANGVFVAPASVTIQASATDSDGTVTNVQFLIGSNVLTNETVAPFCFITNNLPAGNYTLTAVASDNLGARSTNSVNIIVDSPPSIAITNPVSGTIFIAPASVTIQASASDADGTVTNVQFLVGSNVLSNAATDPFSVVTNNLPAGDYTLSAIASDNFGVETTNCVNIIVDLPPAVTITNPADGAVLSEPATVTIQVSAMDTDGTVTNLQFLVDSNTLANVTVAPFSAISSNLPAGSHTLSAIASDDDGVTTTNTIAISVVTPLPLVINPPQFSGANFQFSYAASVGLSYIIQQSTNLAVSNWFTIFTNTATNNPAVFMDNFATNNPAFYRVGLLPNP